MTRAVLEQAAKNKPVTAAAPRRPSGRVSPLVAPARRPPAIDEARALARWIPEDAQWRLFPELRPWALYLDIETTGLSEDDPITVVGLGGARLTRALVRGRGLTRRALARALRNARLLVTFNGASFDLPRLRRAFPGLPWDLPHFDLASTGRRLGLHGGLKGVERTLGCRRPPSLEGLDGAGAARLWRQHEQGVSGARRLLARYCRADVHGLIEIAPRIHDRLLAQLGPEELLAGRLLLPSA